MEEKRSISAFWKWLGVDEGGPSQGMLSPSQMIGLPNRCHRTDLEKLVFSAKTVGLRSHDPKKLQDFLDKDHAALKSDGHWQ